MNTKAENWVSDEYNYFRSAMQSVPTNQRQQCASVALCPSSLLSEGLWSFIAVPSDVYAICDSKS